MFLLREYKAYHSAYHLQKFLLNTQGLKVLNSLVVLFSLVCISLSYRVKLTINISSEQQKIVHCCSKGLLVYLNGIKHILSQEGMADYERNHFQLIGVVSYSFSQGGMGMNLKTFKATFYSSSQVIILMNESCI